MSCIQWAVLIEIIGFSLTSVFILNKIGGINSIGVWINDKIVRIGKRYERQLESYETKIRESPFKHLVDTFIVEEVIPRWYWLLFGGIIIMVIFSCIWLYITPTNKIRLIVLIRRRKKHRKDAKVQKDFRDSVRRIKDTREGVVSNITIGALLTSAGIWSLLYVILFDEIMLVLIYLEIILGFIASRLVGRITDWCIGIGTFIIIVGLILEFVFTS